jgi:hypothetical protein
MSPVRRLLRQVATVVAAAWLVGLASPLVASHHELDAACGEVATSDHLRTAFEEVLPPVHSGHCDVCHLQRILRGIAAERHVAQSCECPAGLHAGGPLPSVRSAERPAGPSRAPPATRL